MKTYSYVNNYKTTYAHIVQAAGIQVLDGFGLTFQDVRFLQGSPDPAESHDRVPPQSPARPLQPSRVPYKTFTPLHSPLQDPTPLHSPLLDLYNPLESPTRPPHPSTVLYKTLTPLHTLNSTLRATPLTPHSKQHPQLHIQSNTLNSTFKATPTTPHSMQHP